MNVLNLFHAVAGNRELRRGTARIHVHCQVDYERIATVEDGRGGIQTFWHARGRRFPDVPRLDCEKHGWLEVDVVRLREKLDAARSDGRPRTLKAQPLS